MIGVLLQLAKAPISALTAFSAAAGFALQRGGLGAALFALVPGVFLLAAGSSALNQIQERSPDARMERTRRRPLPSGRLSLPAACWLTGLWISLGLLLLGLGCGPRPAALGALAALWYNGIYTPLKRRSALASLVGGVIGALPPAIGWSAAGGRLDAPALLVLAGFMFLWQVPHFWLISLCYEEQYRVTRFPLLISCFSRAQLGRMLCVWMLAVGISIQAFPLFGLVRLGPAWCGLALLSGWLGREAVRSLSWPRGGEATLIHLRRAINLFAALTLLVLFVDAGLFGER